MPTDPARTARLRCEPLEDRLTPATLPATEAALVATSIQPTTFNTGASTTVTLSSANPTVTLPVGQITQFIPFAGYAGPVFVARGDVTGDGVGDVVVGAAVSGHVKVLDGATGAEVRSFLAYPGYTGAVRVAAGDVNGDGLADIITAAEINGHVKLFDGATGNEVASFFTAPGFVGPVDVAATRTLGTTVSVIRPYVAVAAQGQVRVFDVFTGAAATFGGVPASGFAPYAGYTGPVYVAVADVTGDGVPDLITGASNGHLKTFDGLSGSLVASFLDPRGVVVDVAAADADGGTGTGGQPKYDIVAGESALFSAYDGRTGTRFQTFSLIDRLNTNSVYVG